ncbi:MAG: nucleotidyl transferase AbiEii/AbiGii toxin family protein [Ignavibacteriaceae bacterium]
MNTSMWHKEILPPASHEVLSDLLQTIPLSRFYLAGGTGLALLLGHRLSRDFDFFSTQLFNEESLIQGMQGLKNLTIVAKSEHTLHITLRELKVSFLGYTYPLLYQTRNINRRLAYPLTLLMKEILPV